LEGHVGAVHGMVLAVEQRGSDIDHREAQRPALQVVADPLLHRADEGAGYRAAYDLVVELEACTALLRPDLDMYIGELAVTAGLPLESRMLLGLPADGLAIADRGTAMLDRQVEAVLQPVERDVEVHLALSIEQQLVRIGIVAEGQRRIVLAE